MNLRSGLIFVFLSGLLVTLSLGLLVAQHDTSLTYLGRYFIHYNGKYNMGKEIKNVKTGKIIIVHPSASDTNFQRHVYETKDSMTYYVDRYANQDFPIYANGFLRYDSAGYRHGPSWQYREDGSLYAQGNYYNDKRDGKWKFYRNDGKIGAYVIYSHDSIVKRLCMFKDTLANNQPELCEAFPIISGLSIDSLKHKINQFLQDHHVKGKYEISVAVFVNHFGRLTDHSYFEVENKYWRSILQVIKDIKFTRPAYKNGVEANSYVGLLFTFGRNTRMPYSTVEISVVEQTIFQR